MSSFSCPKTPSSSAFLIRPSSLLPPSLSSHTAFRASLLVIQSCLIGLNGPPDIPVVLENLAQITAAAYELGLHVEPADAPAAHSVNREGGEGGRGGNDADERRALWWRFLELQV